MCVRRCVLRLLVELGEGPRKKCAAVSLVSLFSLQRIVVTVVGDHCVGVVVAVVAVVGVVWSGLIWSRAGACVYVCVRACALLL